MPTIASSPATTMNTRKTPDSSTCSLVVASTSSHTTASAGKPLALRTAASARSEMCEWISSRAIEPFSFRPSPRRSAITLLASSRATSARTRSPAGRRAAPGTWTTLDTADERSSAARVASARSAGATIRRWITRGAYCGRRAAPGARGRRGSVLLEELVPGGERRVREVGEQAVDPERVEELVLLLRVAGVVGGEVLRVVAERPRVDVEVATVGAAHDRGRPRELAIPLVDPAVARDVVGRAVAVGVGAGGGHDVGLPRRDDVGVPRDLVQPGVRRQVPVRAGEELGVARDGPVVRPQRGLRVLERAVEVDVPGVDELAQRDRRDPVEVAQVRLLEGLDDHRRPPAVEAGAAERLDDAALEREAELLVVGRVLRLGVDAYGAAALAAGAPGELQHLVERGDLEAVVELLRALRHRLPGAQGPELPQREVGDEPVLDIRAVDVAGPLALGELRGDVRRAADPRLVAGDEHAVLGGHQVRLDVVGAPPDPQGIGLEGVLGQVAARAAVGGDERQVVVAVVARLVRLRERGREGQPARAGGQGGRGGGAQGLHGRGPPRRGRTRDSTGCSAADVRSVARRSSRPSAGRERTVQDVLQQRCAAWAA